MGDRQLDDAQASPRRAHLHLKVPAIARLAHAEPDQRVAPYRAKRSHIGIADAIQEPQRGTDRIAGEDLVGAHAVRLAGTAGARSDDEIGPSLGDRRDQFGDQLRAIAAVAVEEDDDVAIPGRLGAGPAGPAVAAAAFADDPRPGGAGPLDGAVGAGAVGDDDVIDAARRDRGNDPGDRCFLIEGRDHHGHKLATCGGHGAQRLQRKPQPAQAAGGWSLNSALRKAW